MFEVAGTAVTGEKIYLQLKWNVTPGTGENKYKRVILASIDITESKKVQKALENASARLETIVDTIDGIVWTADPETLKLNFISKSVQDITGYTSDQFVGREMYKFNFDFYADQKQMDRFRRKIMKGIPGTLEYPIKTKSGEEKWLQVNVSFIKEGEAVQLILGIVIDITLLKKSKNELNQSMKVLSDQNKRLLNFSYIVSHNLRSHSSNILSLCELINHTKDAGEKEGLIRLLGEVAKLLHNTMEGLNEVAGIQSSAAIPKETLNLRDYIDNCYYVLSDRITLKNVRFINNVAPSVMVSYNRAYLESVLQNVIANAIKFSHPDRVPEISLDFYNTGNEKLLAVTDNGVGIDLKKKGKRLFSLFKNFSVDEKSRGIGLYIVKNQAEAMGGNVTVESQPGEGSCFKIFFK